MRMYEPIWKELKSKGICTIKAPPAFHKRIIKAVTKEKYQDITFKVEMDERKLFLKIETEKDTITFMLTKSITVQDI